MEDKDTFVILKTTNILCRARQPRYFTERFDLTHKWLSVRPQCAYRASRIRYPGPLISIDETIYLCPRVLSIGAGHLSMGTSRMRGTPNHGGEPLLRGHSTFLHLTEHRDSFYELLVSVDQWNRFCRSCSGDFINQ